MFRSNRRSIPSLQAPAPEKVQSSNPQLEREFQYELNRIVRAAKNVDRVPKPREAWNSIVKVFHTAIDAD